MFSGKSGNRDYCRKEEAGDSGVTDQDWKILPLQCET